MNLKEIENSKIGERMRDILVNLYYRVGVGSELGPFWFSSRRREERGGG